jgi:hypothetical protein
MQTPFQGSEAGQGIEVSCARLHLVRRAELV